MKHEVITASAGSGKTYRLSNRIIALLLDGVEPEKIIALTFTRKAAGEFAGALFEKISEAALDVGKAAQVCEDLGRSGQYECADFLAILQKVVQVLPDLYLGTLDSFFSSMVQAFQMELGLSNGSGLQILEGAELDELRSEMIRELLLSSEISEENQQAFLQDFKQANYGKEKVEVIKTMVEFVKDWHRTYLEQGGEFRWGETDALTEGRSLQDWKSQKEERITDWNTVFEERKFGHKSAEKGLMKFGADLDGFAGASGFDGKKIMTGLLGVKDDLFAGNPTSFKFYGKDIDLDREQSVRIGKVLRAMGDEELRVPAERARAMYLVISVYEAVYNQLGRQAGKLAFDDLKYLLGQWQNNEEARLRREVIDYRLDARYDHWLLDEFQDTSQDQWDSLEPLLDEVGQDRSGQRSLFVVGDTKQAIYQWRGGDPKLFGNVATRYGIEPEGMAVSWRSQEPVLSLVNAICGNEPVMRAKFGAAVDKWDWQDHRKAEGLEVKSAYSEVRECEDTEEKQEYLISLLEELAPVERGLSCALLLRKNDDVPVYAELLRKAGFPVAEEGKVSPATDNPLGLLILDWLKWMANPSDQYALNHLLMSPLVTVCPQLKSGPESQWQSWNEALHLQGLVPAIEEVFRPLRATLSAFALDRMETILEFLRSFRSDLASTVRQLEHFEVSVAETADVIQVMTIHKSKGLGFEIVILPELANASIINAGRYSKLLVENEYGTSYQAPPVKWARPMFPEIAAHEESWRMEQYYDSFCLLYVALTRAKRGLYCLLDQASNPRAEDGLGGWIEDSLSPCKTDDEAVLYEAGDPHWATQIDKIEASGSEEFSDDAIDLPQKRGRSTGGSKLLQRKAFADNSALDHGTMVHELMECIDWLPALPTPLPEDISVVLESIPQGEKYIAKLSQPEVRALFVKPEGNARLFREQALEWIGSDGLWNTVRLDRFVLHLDESGKLTRIQLIDFKTDASGDLHAKYQDQLQRYELGLKAVYGNVPIESNLVALG